MAFRWIAILAATAALASLTTPALAQSGPPAATPHTPDGKPDLNGMWGGGPAPRAAAFDVVMASRRCAPTQVECDARTNQSIDGEFTGRSRPDQPLYKPQFWDRVQYLDMNTNKEDPIFRCQPYGIGRLGPPGRIVQSENEVIFLYRPGGGPQGGPQPADYRIIPTDGRPHDPIRAIDVTYYGDSVGKWERDTLVIDSVGFNDLTWLDVGGFFTSDQKHTIERLRRDGDVLSYQVTIDDPEVLVEPWVMAPVLTPLNTDPTAYLPEGVPCKDYDSENMSSQIRH